VGQRPGAVEGVVGLSPPRADLLEIVERSAASWPVLRGKRLLVTGAAGFLGSYLCHAVALANDDVLRGDPCRLVCLDTFVTGTSSRLAVLAKRDDVSIVEGSATTVTDLNADLVIHAASIASPPVYRRLPIETVEVNVLGTWRLLQLATADRINSFLHVSSSEVYGDPDPEAVPTAEDYWGRVSFTGPRACYDESKRLGETLCTLYHERHGVPVKVVRPFNVYGPGLRLDDGRIVPDLLRQGLAGGPLVLHSDGTPTRAFCYVVDAIVAFLAVLASEHDGEAFNVGTPIETSIRELAETVAELLGISGVRSEAAADPRYLVDSPQRRCPDIRKLSSHTHWRPEIDLRDGLARTIAFYREQV
jgi:dTDP-glucose 4,6-dehydratase/UDP-glucuronate decarboxylase